MSWSYLETRSSFVDRLCGSGSGPGLFLAPEKKNMRPGALDTEAEQTLWILVFAAFAECISSCFVPKWIHIETNINVSATVLNLLGSFGEGYMYSYDAYADDLGQAQLAQMFRIGFFGVFTSYSYMVLHGSYLSSSIPILGPIYVLGTMSFACIAFEFGRLFATLVRGLEPTYRTSKKGSLKRHSTQFSVLFYLVLSGIGITLARAMFGPSGFVRDPNDPQFIGEYQIPDGAELAVDG